MRQSHCARRYSDNALIISIKKPGHVGAFVGGPGLARSAVTGAVRLAVVASWMTWR
jgi:hypothetical protein